MSLGVCELCGRCRRRQRHHVVSRGMGNAHTIDDPWNVMFICGECHGIIHNEGTAGVLRIVIARLRGTTQERVRERIRELRNA